ncbi:MAG: GNAT family N-acetyltransferase [Alphaproteobacteria bacterium]
MTDTNTRTMNPAPSVERLRAFSPGDLNDLCDATYAAIEHGGGFGWVKAPPRDILERYWQGVVAMPSRMLFVARLDHVICGTLQLVKPPVNNEAQGHALQLTSNFVAPWARGHGLASLLLSEAEEEARREGYSVINLDVRETMERAIKLYEGAGYTRIGTHPDYAHVDGRILQGFYYYKNITQA